MAFRFHRRLVILEIFLPSLPSEICWPDVNRVDHLMTPQRVDGVRVGTDSIETNTAGNTLLFIVPSFINVITCKTDTYLMHNSKVVNAIVS